MRAAAPRTLVWVDRQGRETPIPAPPRAYVYPRLSPDGTRIAVCAADQEWDLWIWDLARATLTRLTFDPGLDASRSGRPTAGGSCSAQTGRRTRNLYVQAADGTGSATRLTESAQPRRIPTACHADGTRVVFHEADADRRATICGC